VKLEAKSEIREIQIAGDWAWCRSDVDVTSTSPGEKPVHRAGPVLTIFRKKPDGGWVLARDANLLAVVES
jgi:ketosteroid isomerase-like protein